MLQSNQNNFDFFELDSQALLPSVPCNILKAPSTHSTIKMLKREREKNRLFVAVLCAQHSVCESQWKRKGLLSFSSEHFYNRVCGG